MAFPIFVHPNCGWNLQRKRCPVSKVTGSFPEPSPVTPVTITLRFNSSMSCWNEAILNSTNKDRSNLGKSRISEHNFSRTCQTPHLKRKRPKKGLLNQKSNWYKLMSWDMLHIQLSIISVMVFSAPPGQLNGYLPFKYCFFRNSSGDSTWQLCLSKPAIPPSWCNVGNASYTFFWQTHQLW